MTTLPPLDLRLIRQHIVLFHEGAAPFAGRGSLLLGATGIDPTRPQPLPALEQRFAIGAIDPMVEMAMRWNREPGRNVHLAPAVYDGTSSEILGVFGFVVALQAGEAAWLQRLPFAPSAALAAAGTIWGLYLFDRPAPVDEVLPLVQRVQAFALGGAPGEVDLGRGTPLAGGLYMPPNGAAAAVELTLPWQQGRYDLAQTMAINEAAGTKRRQRFDAVSPAAARDDRDAGGADDKAADDHGGEDDETRHADAAPDDLASRFGRLALSLHARSRRIEIGSDVEIAQRCARELTGAFGEVVYAEGALWFYGDRCWRPIEGDLQRRLVHAFDGAVYSRPNGKPDLVQLGKHRVDSVGRELGSILAQPDFFVETAVGLNCRDGFVRFAPDGAAELIPHRPEHRHRHMLAGRWDRWLSEAAEDPPEKSLLYTLLKGCFRGDPDGDDKCRLVAELAGVAATGYATRLRQPQALICLGSAANNGKSQVLDLLRAMLPPEAVASVPATKFTDDRFIIRLVGKHLNAPDELSNSTVIASDQFKKVITGEPVMGRDVYKSGVEFRPQALHVFATNVLPLFAGGFDRGVRRRLALLVFNRAIPIDEQIQGLGRRIAAEEPDLLLGLAVAGMQRLLRQKVFTQPESSRRELHQWFTGADPVLAWVQAQLRPRDPADYLPGAEDRGFPSAEVFHHFEGWAKAAGFRPGLQVNSFVQRLRSAARYVRIKHTKAGNRLLGFIIGNPPDGDDDDDAGPAARE